MTKYVLSGGEGEKTAEMTEAGNVMSGGGYRGEKENYCKLR